MPLILILDTILPLPAPHPIKDRRLPELDTVLQLCHHSSTLSLKLLHGFFKKMHFKSAFNKSSGPSGCNNVSPLASACGLLSARQHRDIARMTPGSGEWWPGGWLGRGGEGQQQRVTLLTISGGRHRPLVTLDRPRPPPEVTHEAVSVAQPLPPQPAHPGGLPHREAAEHPARGKRRDHVLLAPPGAGQAEHLTQLPLDLGVPVAVEQRRERGVQGGGQRDQGGDRGRVTQHLSHVTHYTRDTVMMDSTWTQWPM